MNRSSLRSRLLGAFAILGVSLIAVCALATLALTQLGGAVGLILKENYISVIACEGMSAALHREDAAALLASRGQIDLARPELAAGAREFDAAFATEAANITLPGEGDLVAQVRARYATYRERLHAGDGKVTPERYVNELVPAFRAVDETVLAIQQLNQRNMEEEDGHARTLARRTFFVAVALSLISLLLVGVLLHRLRGAILSPLVAFTERARAIGEGKLDADMPASELDELTTLADALRRMQEKLRAYRESSLGELLQAKDLSRATVSAMPEPVMVFGPRAELLLANDAAATIFQLSVESEQEWTSVRKDIPDPIAHARNAVLERGEPLVPQSLADAMRWIAPTGQGERYFLVSASPLLAEEADKPGALVVAQDVTRFRRIDALKSDVVATVSHELKTPLTSLRLATHMLLDDATGPLTEVQRDLATTARAETERLQSTVNELLDLVRIEREAGALHLSEINARSLLLEVEAAVHTIAQAKEVVVAVDAPEDLLVTLAPEQMTIVLTNIASNAVRHSSHGGRVVLEAQRHGDEVVLAVRDDGEGIRPEDLPHVFERRWTGADPTKLKGRHGLGLAIAREIVERHSGSIAVESTVGKGTVFRVTLGGPSS